jgi:hypothetical protein
MTSIWLESLGRTFDAALDQLAAALRDSVCVKYLWTGVYAKCGA